ncbi:adenosylmethionine decarboxylase [Rahnella sp. WP5]|uniref:adenosylmethionine decarboxylase n=1 Tax=Rahnella sp. WP5 TaxID=1500266 RepID=UPI00055F61B8|nr:adenosylmethionine decarboxylase [Rahnella sp. WP5]
MDDTGHHYLIDIISKDVEFLKDEKSLTHSFEKILHLSNFHIIGRLVYKFQSGGEGVTGVFLLSESHLSFHTYPETGYISIDLYTCGKDAVNLSRDIEAIFNNATKFRARYIERGSTFLAKANPFFTSPAVVLEDNRNETH